MTRPPARSVTPSISPSMESGTPDSISAGASSGPPGQFRRTSSWLPPMPPEVTITAPAPSAKSPTATRDVGSPRADRRRLQHLAGDPDDVVAVTEQFGDPVPEAHLDPAGPDVLGDPPDERRQHAGSRSPGEVEAGNRVAVPADLITAAFRPLDDREQRSPCSLSHARFSPAAKST